ncbi:MAG TPA: patatin-like phospholipase family protein [Nitrospiraceae bacterium]|nr:patatin-like phospholipase family protein [Nitrospiraceae bacterium]
MLSLLRSCIIALMLATAGCEYVRPTLNAPLDRWDVRYGYRYTNFPQSPDGSSDSLFLVASFSGGGMRASALAYGALQELAHTTITWEGKNERLLDEMSIVTALSGGSFTAAYYALYGDRIFEDFEPRFLRRDWERKLKARIFWSPYNWVRLLSPYFGRSHVMAELLDEALFDGHTYGDLLKRHQRPMVFIHASDMAMLSRFEFNQRQFDIICSDLSQLPIATATAASSALPLLLSPMSLKNYAGQCGYQPPLWLREPRQTSAGQQRAAELRSYFDAERRPYVHLLDGGLADNVGMRSMVETVALMGDAEALFKALGVMKVRKLVFLVVRAETIPDVASYRFSEIPVLSRALRALIDIPINRYSIDTLHLMRLAVEGWRTALQQKERGEGSVFAPDADVYFINASLSELDDPVERESLMKIPTSLRLTNDQVDRLIKAAGRLIQNDPDFQRLMHDLQ